MRAICLRPRADLCQQLGLHWQIRVVVSRNVYSLYVGEEGGGAGRKGVDEQLKIMASKLYHHTPRRPPTYTMSKPPKF